MSIRLLTARPGSVAFSCTGSVSPSPREQAQSGATPPRINRSRTAPERSSDTRRLTVPEPRLSECPSISRTISSRLRRPTAIFCNNATASLVSVAVPCSNRLNNRIVTPRLPWTTKTPDGRTDRIEFSSSSESLTPERATPSGVALDETWTIGFGVWSDVRDGRLLWPSQNASAARAVPVMGDN